MLCPLPGGELAADGGRDWFSYKRINLIETLHHAIELPPDEATRSLHSLFPQNSKIKENTGKTRLHQSVHQRPQH